MNRREFITISTGAPLMASPFLWDAEGQRRRRRKVNELHRKACAAYFSDGGVWIGPPTEKTARVRFWHAMSLLDAAAARDKANAIIRKCFADRAGLAPFSHFEYCAGAQMLTKQKEHIAADNRDSLSRMLSEALGRQTSIQFRGYNDNCVFQRCRSLIPI